MSGDHAGRMDAIYATQRHFYDLTRKYYLLGRDALVRDLAPPPTGTVLEVGCGTARNLIAAAKRWPEARFFGFDISQAMLETAGRNVAKAGLSERITLAQGDATDFEAQTLFGIARFDRVFLSYTLSMIPGWQAAIGQAVAAGERVMIVDFGQQERLPRAFRDALFKWLDHFDVTPPGELDEVAATTGALHKLPVRFEQLYRGYTWRAVIG